MSLTLRLLITVLTAITLSLGISTATSTYLSVGEMRTELIREYQNKLTANKELLKAEIEDYFTIIENQITTLANHVMTQEAAAAFAESFQRYQPETVASPTEMRSVVEQYYTEQFAKKYQQLNPDTINGSALLSGLSDLSVYMQYDFIAANPNSLGEKDKLYTLGNGSEYDQQHQRYHSSFHQFLDAFGYYDIFIVEPSQGHVVYSVFKELDFATSLESGPYADSGLGVAYQRAKALNKGDIYLSDFAPYLPSYNAPASFMSTPIYQDDTLVGVLIFQMPINAINRIMTQDSQWQERGFGQSGETYLVGPDQTLRNESRFFIEDKTNYLAAIGASDPQIAQQIELKNTSIALQSVNTPGVTQALNGINGFAIFEDYRGVPVLSAYSPVKVSNQTWAILSEVDEQEALVLLDELTQQFIYTGAITVILVVIVSAVLLTLIFKLLLRPLQALKAQFAQLNSSDANLSVRMRTSNITEFDALALSFNGFIEQIQDIVHRVKGNTEGITKSTGKLSEETVRAYQSVEQQDDQVISINESMVQFNQALAEVSESSASAFDYTTQCRDTALTNAEQAAQVVRHVEQLGGEVTDSAEQLTQLQTEVANIEQVLKIITGIAEQTNLLALNAAIEAARAGESGRGFAVVADEVRQLANKTQSSTVQIQDNIHRLLAVTNTTAESMQRSSRSASEGVALVREVSENLKALSSEIDELSTINSTVAAANEQQKASCDHINQSILQIKSSTNALKEVAKGINNESRVLTDVSANLQGVVGQFNSE